MTKRFFYINSAIFLCLILIPYLAAWIFAGSDYVFGGFLLNIQDGNSYLAKMYEGWRGEWLFTLPFSTEPGQGALLFLFYILLGQIGKLTGIPLIVVYHMARIFSAFILAWQLKVFFIDIFKEQPEQIKRAFQWSLFGGGIGWILLFWGVIPTDMWVAEAYPFLSSYVNPHFALGLAIMVWFFHQLIRPGDRSSYIRLGLLGLILSSIMPFGIVLVGTIGLVFSIFSYLRTRATWPFRKLIAMLLLGGPFLLYQYWTILNHPVLNAWNAQNLTPSPRPIDLLLSFSPAFILATIGLIIRFRIKGPLGQSFLSTWILVGLLLIFFPFSLQRRFLVGLFIPVVGLATQGIADIGSVLPFQIDEKKVYRILFATSLISNFLVIGLGFFGSISHSKELYLSRSEARAMSFIQKNLPENAIIICSPGTGNFIPAWTGRRVLYGHQFETINGEKQKKLVESFFTISDPEISAKILTDNDVDFVFWGPRERSLGNPDLLNSLKKIYSHGDVEIFEQ